MLLSGHLISLAPYLVRYLSLARARFSFSSTSMEEMDEMEIGKLDEDLKITGSDDSEDGEQERHINAYGSFVRTREQYQVASPATSNVTRVVRNRNPTLYILLVCI